MVIGQFNFDSLNEATDEQLKFTLYCDEWREDFIFNFRLELIYE